MTERVEHLEELTLEQLAEGTLPAAEAALARGHLERCARCSAELEAFAALFGLLGSLPRYGPSPAFADAVMARVQFVQQESWVVAWIRRFIPSSRRGWMALAAAAIAPALPILALLAWIFTQPMTTPAALWQWTLLRFQAAAQTGFAWLLDRAASSGLLDWIDAGYTLVQNIPPATAGVVAATLAVAFPLSAWTLVRLIRTPAASVNYAN